MDLTSLRADAEALSTACGEARLRHASGGGQPDWTGIAKAHRDTWDHEAFVLAREAAAGAAQKGEEKRARRLSLLTAHLFEQRARLRAAPAHDAIALVSQDDRALAAETKRGARQELARSQDETQSGVNGHRHAALEAWNLTSRESDFSDTVAAIATLSGIDVDALAAQAQPFLDDTAAMHADVLAWWLKRTLELRPFPHGAAAHDLAHAFGPHAFEGLFPKGDPKFLVRRADALGFAPAHVRQLRIEVDERPARIVTALAVDAPTRVQLVARETKGFSGAAEFLNAFGQALHLSGITAERPFEDRHAFDPALPLSTGFLFESWLLDANWLRRTLDAEAPDLVRVTALIELTRTRQAAARLLSDVAMHRQGPSAAVVSAGTERLSLAQGAEASSQALLTGVEHPRRAIDELRARALEAHWFEALRDRFDVDWWKNPRAGAFLEKRFESGGFESFESLSASLTGRTPSLDDARRRLEALLA